MQKFDLRRFLITAATVILMVLAPTSSMAAPANHHRVNNQIWEPGQTVYVYTDEHAGPEVQNATQEAINQWNQAGVLKLVPTVDYNQCDICVTQGKLLSSDRRYMILGRTFHNQFKHRDGSKIEEVVINEDAIEKGLSQDPNNSTTTDTVEHELGHALGLHHTSENVKSCMCPEAPGHITHYDLNTLKALYR